MAAGPIDDIFYIHKAILKETREFEEGVSEFNREDDHQISVLLDRFQFLRSVLKEHEQGEEEFLFPPLEARLSHSAKPYVSDHDHHSALYPEIEELLRGLMGARGNQERIGLARRLNRQAIALNVMMECHVTKENELLVPAFYELFSNEEIVEIRDTDMAKVPPEVMTNIIPWMFRSQTVDDREGMLRLAMEQFPPEMLNGMVQLFSSAVSSPEWQEMVRRIPELPPGPV